MKYLRINCLGVPVWEKLIIMEPIFPSNFDNDQLPMLAAGSTGGLDYVKKNYSDVSDACSLGEYDWMGK